LSLPQFLSGLAQWAQGQPVDPSKWQFGELKRQSDGSFQDAELVDLLRIGTENVAGKSLFSTAGWSSLIDCATGAFGARNIPAAMKAIEILGIETGRKWNMATLNEVRLFFKLKAHATFRKYVESKIWLDY
jgi:hypothetical protein